MKQTYRISMDIEFNDYESCSLIARDYLLNTSRVSGIDNAILVEWRPLEAETWQEMEVPSTKVRKGDQILEYCYTNTHSARELEKTEIRSTLREPFLVESIMNKPSSTVIVCLGTTHLSSIHLQKDFCVVQILREVSK